MQIFQCKSKDFDPNNQRSVNVKWNWTEHSLRETEFKDYQPIDAMIRNNEMVTRMQIRNMTFWPKHLHPIWIRPWYTLIPSIYWYIRILMRLPKIGWYECRASYKDCYDNRVTGHMIIPSAKNGGRHLWELLFRDNKATDDWKALQVTEGNKGSRWRGKLKLFSQ